MMKKLFLFLAFISVSLFSAYAAFPVTTSCGVTVYYIASQDATMDEILEDIQAIEEYYCGQKN